MNGLERFAVSNLPLYGYGRATGNRGGFNRDVGGVCFGTFALGLLADIPSCRHCPHADITPLILMLVCGQSSITLLGFDPVAPLRFYTDAASP
jgi:hypothetical protein